MVTLEPLNRLLHSELVLDLVSGKLFLTANKFNRVDWSNFDRSVSPLMNQYELLCYLSTGQRRRFCAYRFI